MKKLNILTLLILLVVSCQKDDEVTISRNDTPQHLSEQNITDTSVTLIWDDMQASSYRIEYGLSDFGRGEGTVLTTTGTSITIENLEADTTYDYYVEADYSASNTNVVRSVRRFTTRFVPVVPQFKPNLSQLKIFRGAVKNLIISPYAFEYDLNTRLYTDNAHKQRVFALPLGTSMVYDGDGLPIFPDNTVIAKTFYYNVDDRNLSLGKNLIETRVMIKINGEWQFGDYIWNEAQTDAILNNDGSIKPITWTDTAGTSHNVNYEIPSEADCYMCHQSYGTPVPIGPKLKSMNFEILGINQLQRMITKGELTNAPAVSSISSLPNWEDTNLDDETRIRAYFDMNCAHCHSPGGYHTENYYDALNLNFETSFQDSHIFNKKDNIMSRMQSSVDLYSMPFIGVSMPHQEALDLIIPFLQSL